MSGKTFLPIVYRSAIAITILLAAAVTGCKPGLSETTLTPTVEIPEVTPTIPASPTAPAITLDQPSPTPALSAYAFPQSIDATKLYLFYLHGRIVEDQGIHAVSPEFGAYEYEAILEKLSGYGFVVISEPRPRNADSMASAEKIAAQVTALLNAGVPPNNITVVGASKGAAIAIIISHLLANEALNYVILSICHPDEIAALKADHVTLYGNVLSIYDSSDTEYAGSCQELFSFSEGKGLARHAEIVLHVGTGHGILYKPLDEWIIPLVQWAKSP